MIIDKNHQEKINFIFKYCFDNEIKTVKYNKFGYSEKEGKRENKNIKIHNDMNIQKYIELNIYDIDSCKVTIGNSVSPFEFEDFIKTVDFLLRFKV